LLGVLVTLTYLLTLSYAIAHNSMNFQLIWVIVTVIFAIERAVTVHGRGWKQTVLGAVLIVEMCYDFTLQAIHMKALFDALRRAKKSW
jgi:hypothetical protein